MMHVVYVAPRRERVGTIITNHENGREMFCSVRARRGESHYAAGTQDAAMEEGSILVEAREGEAELAGTIARVMALEYPMEDVYVAKVVQVFSSIRPDVIEKKINERGVLPA